jgi:hypothetical protein
MAAEEIPETEPQVLEAGRYKLSLTPDGGWVIARATATCDRCADCGCGDQSDLIQVPAMFVKMATAMQSGNAGAIASARSMMRMVTGRD